MLMIERTFRFAYSHLLGEGFKMPRKGQVIFLSSPYIPDGLGVWWTERKSPEGERLFNIGKVRISGEQPPISDCEGVIMQNEQTKQKGKPSREYRKAREQKRGQA